MKRVLSLSSSAVLLVSSLLTVNALAAGGHKPVAKTITIQLCSSTPYGVPGLKLQSEGIRNAVNLAIYQMRPKLLKVGVRIGPQILLDDAKPDGSNYSPDVEHSNALQCLGNSHTMGYVGTLNSGAALASEPVLNRAHMVMISPANTNPELTSLNQYQGAGGRASQEPATFKHQIPWVTYYRTVTTDALQGPTGALFAKNRLHVKSFYLVDDKTTYGAGLASTFGAEARRLGLKQLGSGHIDSSSSAAEAQSSQALSSQIISSHPDMVYCGCNPNTAPALPRDLRGGGYSNPFMGGDALVTPTWITSVGVGARSQYATNVGPPASKASVAFTRLYKKLFPGFYANPGPESYDAPAFDATSIILTAIWKAAKAHALTGTATHMRTMVVKYVHNIRFVGATGVTTFDSNGDTSNRILSVYAVHSNKWLFMQELQAPKGFKPTG